MEVLLANLFNVTTQETHWQLPVTDNLGAQSFEFVCKVKIKAPEYLGWGKEELALRVVYNPEMQ